MTEYALRFRYSSSPGYEEAVRIARTMPGCVVDETGRRATHTVPVQPESLTAVSQLLGIVRGWRSTELLADGVPLSVARLWALERVVSCYRDRELSGLEELHCRGFPGPRGGTMPCRLIERSLPWVVPAEYRDVALLPRLLLAHAQQTMVQVCPAYDHAAVVRAAPRALQARGPGTAGGLTLRASLDQQPAADDEERAHIERLLRDVDFGTDA
jgi:hypothetical protein